MAIIKIINESGKYKDSKAIGDVIHYAVSKADEDGVFGGAVLPDIAVVSMEAVAKVYHKEKGTRLRHSVLSFDRGEHVTALQVKDIAQQALTYYQDDYQILAAVHEDKDHLHVHFIMNSVNYRDGSKYHRGIKDYYDFRRHVNRVLRPYRLHAQLAKK